MKRRQILITGGAGVIGSYRADPPIERGHRVRVLACLLSHVEDEARGLTG
ncbi:hypothetical protein [Pyxidicoccus sp. MSG2]|nr:hypothetical protein [Pyxidicoccus sp. MSG2]MCY1020016.1 hypothetical protein [Pyxidicoccus sp. MSG2]